MSGFYKVVTVVGEVLGYVRGSCEAEAKAAAEASARYLEMARAYTRSAECPLVSMAGLRVVPV